MTTNAKEWLHHLMGEARSAGIDHLDLLLNGAVLPEALLPPLLALSPAPECQWLLEHTPEQALAHQGPVLLRIALGDQAHIAATAHLFTAVHAQFCVLALISRWPFDKLAVQLRGTTQATWNKGASSGVLRYYDTRLFRHFCEQLDPEQLAPFHGPVCRWHWIDHDGKKASLCGLDINPQDHSALTGLTLSAAQVQPLHALSAALQWLKKNVCTPAQHGFTSHEALIRCLTGIHLNLSRQQLEKPQHEAFIASALSEFPPLSLTPKKAAL